MEATLKYRGRVISEGISPFVNAKSRILDIGCGNGVIASEIAKYFKCSVTGTDVCEYLVKDIKFRKMPDQKTLDFKNKEFDLGLFNDVLHHVPFENQIVLIKEALRVCHGALIFEVKPTLAAKIAEYPLNWVNNMNVPILLTHRDKNNWLRLFERHNLCCEFYPIKKPAFWYPFINYLFYLKNR